jgi:Na+/H+ antiporter NhaC
VIGLTVAAFAAGSNRLRSLAILGAVSAVTAAVWGLAWGLAAATVGLVAMRMHGRAWTGTERPHLGLGEIARASAVSAPTLGFACVLLFEAWMIGAVCEDLGTGDYLVALLADALAPTLLPVLLFVVAALVAFATGSSWSTMAILLPNAVPLASALGAESALGAGTMVVIAVGAVLDGAVFGDHCSPISDTTVLSSVASGCDHLDHVRTQAPYALCVAGVVIVAGHLPILLGAGWGPWTGLLAGLVGLAGVLVVVGRKVDPARGDAACPPKELP